MPYKTSSTGSVLWSMLDPIVEGNKSTYKVKYKSGNSDFTNVLNYI